MIKCRDCLFWRYQKAGRGACYRNQRWATLKAGRSISEGAMYPYGTCSCSQGVPYSTIADTCVNVLIRNGGLD